MYSIETFFYKIINYEIKYNHKNYYNFHNLLKRKISVIYFYSFILFFFYSHLYSYDTT